MTSHNDADDDDDDDDDDGERDDDERDDDDDDDRDDDGLRRICAHGGVISHLGNAHGGVIITPP